MEGDIKRKGLDFKEFRLTKVQIKLSISHLLLVHYDNFSLDSLN